MGDKSSKIEVIARRKGMVLCPVNSKKYPLTDYHISLAYLRSKWYKRMK